MNKKAISFLVALLMLGVWVETTNTVSPQLLSGSKIPINQTHRVYNMNTSLYYGAIQEAINDPQTLDGHVLLLDLDPFYEHVVINKSIGLSGCIWIEHPEIMTTINGNGTGTVVTIEADNVMLNLIKIVNGTKGVLLQRTNKCTLGPDLRIVDNTQIGIHIEYSSNNTIKRSNITNNGDGISLLFSFNNTISENEIANNDNGVFSSVSAWNTLSSNSIAHNYEAGIGFDFSFNSRIIGNNITNNPYGLKFLTYCKNNRLSQNNFADNAKQVYLYEFSNPPIANFWNNSYPNGNFWSDYEERYPEAEDVYSGPYQNETDGDGIWDYPYVIDQNNIDNYPIVPEFPSFPILPLLMTITLLVVIIYKRRDSTWPDMQTDHM